MPDMRRNTNLPVWRNSNPSGSSKKVTPRTDAPPLPFSLVDRGTSGILHREGRHGQQIAYLYFEDEPQRQLSTKRLSRDEALSRSINMFSFAATTIALLEL